MLLINQQTNYFNGAWERPGESVGITMNAMNTNNTNVQSLTAAIAALTKVLEEAIDIAKEESTTATTGTTATTEATITEAPTATETTATTEVTTTEATETTTTATTPIVVIDDDDNVIATTATAATTPIVVIDDDDNVIATTATADEEDNTEFKGSMINNDPCDPIPAVSEAKADDTAEAEETVPADDEAAEEYLDNISCDISTLYDISTYTLENEGYNIDTDHSPYAPMDNRSASFDNYKVYISKEMIKGGTDVTGEFRMIVSEKNSGVKIMDHSLKIINDHIKASSSENTVRMDKIKDSKKLMRFLEIVDEVSSLIMSKYISK